MQLRDYRKDKRLNLEDVANLAGITPGTVSRHENGRRKPDMDQIETYRKITGGAVTHEDWVKLHKKKPQ
ncbi:MAG: hypothetical protein C0429_06835 [Sphingopyxis sp.]|nr:hypothetical protein [Sphingopyxis sp.]